MNKVLKFVGLCMFCLLLACSETGDINLNETVLVEPDDSPTLASVNGEGITEADVEFMMSRTFSSSDQLFMDEALRKKVLDSLIASKAMQHVMVKELNADKLREIKKRAQAYEEELYVKEYLQMKSTPTPVSSEMVNNYYASHQEDFGGGESRAFELLAQNSAVSEQERNDFIAAQEVLEKNQSWQKYAKNSSLKLRYQKATLRPNLIEKSLESAVLSTEVGSVSDVVFLKSAPYVVRVLSVDKLPAKPLSEVSGVIRKKLAAIQLKKSVKQASIEAMTNAEVVRF